MKLFRLIAISLVLLFGLTASEAQSRSALTQTVSVSGQSVPFPNSNGSMHVSFEELIAGSPATVSIVIQGCMVGTTCETLDTYTTVANTIRSPSISKVYDSFTVTASWTGGTNVSVQINATLTTASSGSSSGSGLPSGCTGTTGQITCSIVATSGSNGGLSGVGGDGSALTPNASNTGYLVPCNTGSSTLCTVANRFNLSWGSSHLGAVPAVGAAGTGGHAAVFSSNGIDLQDGGTPGSNAIPRAALWSYSAPTSGGWTNPGAEIVNTAGAGAAGAVANIANAAAGFYRNYTVTATTGDFYGIDGFANGSSQGAFVVGNNINWAASLGETGVLTFQRFWIGLVDMAHYYVPAGTDTPTTTKLAMFRYSTSASDTHFMCVTGDGSALTVTDSGISPDTNFHVFGMQFTDSVHQVVFTIDGTAVCTNTTHIPSSITFGTTITISTLENVAKSFGLRWVYGQSN